MAHQTKSRIASHHITQQANQVTNQPTNQTNHKLTKLSPFPFVIFGLSPARSACSKISPSPRLAASNNLDASARASGGSSSADAGGAPDVGAGTDADVDVDWGFGSASIAVLCCAVLFWSVTVWIGLDWLCLSFSSGFLVGKGGGGGGGSPSGAMGGRERESKGKTKRG